MDPFLVDDPITYQPSKGYLLWMMKPLSGIRPLSLHLLIGHSHIPQVQPMQVEYPHTQFFLLTVLLETPNVGHT